MGIVSIINQAFKQNTKKYFGTTQFVAQLLQFPFEDREFVSLSKTACP
jgi:hypothetical protein